jgi:hypothetical protein
MLELPTLTRGCSTVVACDLSVALLVSVARTIASACVCVCACLPACLRRVCLLEWCCACSVPALSPHLRGLYVFV